MLLPRLKSDLFPILYHAAAGSLSSPRRSGSARRRSGCYGIRGYPGKYEKNKRISGLEKAKEVEQTFVFHAGTALEDDCIVTAGGRVLNLTAWDLSLESAVKRAYSLTGLIKFEGVHYRRDIAYRALHRD